MRRWALVARSSGDLDTAEQRARRAYKENHPRATELIERILEDRKGPPEPVEAPVEREFRETINMSTEAMMMEAIRLYDEMESLGPKVPDVDSVLTIKRPLVPPLRSLSHELLDTLQLIINYGMVETVLNKSNAGDLETMQDLEYLIKNNYVERVG